MKRKLFREESGQALIELAITATTLCVLIFGIVDFGRAIYDVQVMKNIAGEGSSIASNQLSGSTNAALTAAQTVVTYAGSDLDMAHKGCVIVTVVTNQGGGPPATLAITDQAYDCGITASSQIGCLNGVNGCRSSQATLPQAAQDALRGQVVGSSLYVTEIYYNYNAITPVMSFLRGALPSQFYTVAYY